MFKSLLRVTLLLLITTNVIAGPGHDHGDAPATAASNAPRRAPDGSVFLPKPSQRQLAIRSIEAKTTKEPRTIELPGRVVIDPATGGRVQSTQAGRLQPGPNGMPQPGQKVARGAVLAYVLPSVGLLESANQRAYAAEISAQLESAKKRLARLQQLEGTVPQREIDDATITLASLEVRAASVGNSLSAREALLAPVSGVVAGVAANAIAGQVVDAREVLFEITDPNTITIEATAFDSATAADVAGGAVAIGGKSITLKFVGASRSLREGHLPLMFRASSVKNAANGKPGGQFANFGSVAIGESVKVAVHSKSTLDGIAIPSGALVKNPSNQDIVWVVERPEHFVPRVVRIAPLDGSRVLVVSGLQAGERVVTDGAPLVNQVR